jgi:hypothetical protein
LASLPVVLVSLTRHLHVAAGRLLPYFNAGGVFMVFTGGAILYAALYRTPGTEPADQGSVSWTVFVISLLSAASAVVVNANLEQSLEEISEES